MSNTQTKSHVKKEVHREKFNLFIASLYVVNLFLKGNSHNFYNFIDFDIFSRSDLPHILVAT